MEKYLAEFFGTMVLVFFGCSTAVLCDGVTGGLGVGLLGAVAIALAFGLGIVVTACAIGKISGCHVNPAVSLAVFIQGGMSVGALLGYIAAQALGALAGSGLLAMVVSSSDLGTGIGANGCGVLCGMGLATGAAFTVELLLTFAFVVTVLSVTASEKIFRMEALLIGIALAFVHIIGIPLIGASVNPARSLAPALLTGGEALPRLWLYIVAPLLGAVLAGLFFRFFLSKRLGRKAEEPVRQE